jgi:hypothetical protein
VSVEEGTVLVVNSPLAMLVQGVQEALDSGQVPGLEELRQLVKQKPRNEIVFRRELGVLLGETVGNLYAPLHRTIAGESKSDRTTGREDLQQAAINLVALLVEALAMLEGDVDG